jgi:hypothetical protein
VSERKQKAAVVKAGQAKSTRLAAELLMAARREQHDQEEQQKLEQLSVVVIEITTAEDGAAVTFEVASESGGVVVKTVDSNCVSVALEVLKGYPLRSFESGGVEVAVGGGGGGVGGGGGGNNDVVIAEAARAALSQASAVNPVRVTFSKPAPATPPHGWARKNLRISSDTTVTHAQKKFLEGHCDLFEKKGASLRYTGVYTAMVNLHGLLHVADDKPFVMGETAIFNWLKRRWATQKAAGISLALAAAVSAATAAEEEETDDDDDDDVDVGDGVQVINGSMLIAPPRDLLRSRRLSDSGKKVELIVRLEAHDNEEEPRAQDKTGDAEN